MNPPPLPREVFRSLLTFPKRIKQFRNSPFQYRHRQIVPMCIVFRGEQVRKPLYLATQWASKEISTRNLVEMSVSKMSLYQSTIQYHERQGTDMSSPPHGRLWTFHQKSSCLEASDFRNFWCKSGQVATESQYLETFETHRVALRRPVVGGAGL